MLNMYALLFSSASRYSASPVHCHNDSFNSSISMCEEERAITPTYEIEGGNLEIDDATATKTNIEPKNLLGVGDNILTDTCTFSSIKELAIPRILRQNGIIQIAVRIK